MPTLTLANNANRYQDDDPWSKPTARFHVTHWGAEIVDVVVDNWKSTTASVPDASIQVTAERDGKTLTAVPLSWGGGTENVAVATGEGNTLQFLIGPTAGSTTEGMLTLWNQSSIPVTFMIVSNDVPTQMYPVPANEKFQLPLATEFTAYARVHGYAGEPSGSNGYDTPTVSFTNPGATLSVEGNEKFTIQVS